MTWQTDWVYRAPATEQWRQAKQHAFLFPAPPPGTFPQVEDADTKTGTVTVDSTSWTLTYPTNLVNGDIIIALMGIDGGGEPKTSGWPAGWNEGYDLTGAGNCGGVFYWKRSTGSESGNFSVTISTAEQGAWLLYRITGAHASTDPESTSAGGSSTTPDPPSHTASWGGENTLWIAVCATDRGDRTFDDFPDDYTDTGSVTTGGGDGASIAFGRRELNASAENPTTFTRSGTAAGWRAGTIAIRPAAAPPAAAPYYYRELIGYPTA